MSAKNENADSMDLDDVFGELGSIDLESMDLDSVDLDSMDLDSMDFDSMDLDSIDLDSADLDTGEFEDGFWEDFDKTMGGDSDPGQVKPSDSMMDEPAKPASSSESDLVSVGAEEASTTRQSPETKEDLNEPEASEDIEAAEREALAQMTASMGAFDEDAGELADVDSAGEDADIMELLERMSEDDENLADINDLLKSDENNTAVSDGEDSSEELDQSEVDELLSAINGETPGEGDNPPPSRTEEKKASGEEKKKEPKEKKPGLLKRFLMWFNGTSEEEEDIDPEDNEKILAQLEAEEKEAKAKKKEEKKKKAEEKKAEKAKAKEEKQAEKEKGDKEKKAKQDEKKKKKAEKAKEKEKAKEGAVKPKPLPKAPMALTIAFCVSIVILLRLLTTFSGYTVSIRQAQKYMKDEDYIAAYESLEGMKIQQKDALFYEKIKLLAWMKQDLKSYEVFKKHRMKVEALDALIRGVSCYQENNILARNVGCEMEYQTMYASILEYLSADYKLGEQDALELLKWSQEDGVQYTLRVNKIAN